MPFVAALQPYSRLPGFLGLLQKDFLMRKKMHASSYKPHQRTIHMNNNLRKLSTYAASSLSKAHVFTIDYEGASEKTMTDMYIM